ncbi:ribosomal protein S18-alanine N-acetyltransferase [Halorhodospira abdelmalekii]|uniref:ribosomal protein S18-alanine N-acetyltransferase n=1 Tax=Halorhodospira abdelmalekii TaxID=421629 RepID=UPI001F5BB711|nr:ribosomal protein S18-alanine N-acetyltransferase [Halorhodospira abdelmalekii]
MAEADLAAVLQVERSAYRYPWSEGIFRDCLRAGYGCFVHEPEPDLCGPAAPPIAPVVAHLVTSCAAGEAHILNICVAPPWQRRGIAAYLLAVAVERAQLLGAEALFLEVRPSNTPALRLYERCGFHEVGRRPNYYPAAKGREDALIMARAILSVRC